ncbi:MAG: TonB-dependent receptor [Gemmatimonas sp.]|nr:TonB-dependent receptor [Gemmatimonas sp.]
MSEESFWRINPISTFRLRGAWGKAGRQPSALSGLNTYTTIPGPGGASAIRPDSLGNPAIEPEVSTELELGFDFAMFDDRISGEFTHYWRKDENQLLGVDVQSSYGIPGDVEQNLGRIDNWGWEALVSTRVYDSPSFSFGLDLSADHTDNEIKELGAYNGDVADGILVGLPFPNVITDNWVLSAEFDPDAPAAGNFTNALGERITALCDAGISLAPEGATNSAQYGRMPGGDAVPCSEIPDQQLYVGRGFATHTFSVAPTIGLFGNQLQIFALAEGQYGRTNLDNAHAWGHFYNNSKIAQLENDALWVASDRLNETGVDHAKTIYDASFWKLRDVGARYNLPQSIVQRTGADRVSLAISGRNLWTIWRAQEEIWGHAITDPEFGDPTVQGGGGNFYSIPPLSSVNATLRVSF